MVLLINKKNAISALMEPPRKPSVSGPPIKMTQPGCHGNARAPRLTRSLRTQVRTWRHGGRKAADRGCFQPAATRAHVLRHSRCFQSQINTFLFPTRRIRRWNYRRERQLLARSREDVRAWKPTLSSELTVKMWTHNYLFQMKQSEYSVLLNI